MTPDERSVMGPALNGLKDRVRPGDRRAPRGAQGRGDLARRLVEERVDVTLPLRPSPLETGRIHPVSQVIDEITVIFADLGFSIAEGPDIETDYYNFTALNFPDGHPARDMHDTFFFRPKADGERMLLRTHTSPVQIRTMEKTKPPIRVIIPGPHLPLRFRPDPHADVPSGRGAGDRRGKPHRPPQVGAGGILQGVLRGRPASRCASGRAIFPFTEPSMEVDIGCRRQGNEIRFGEGDDWLEILGCGMVHPNVSAPAAIDPDKYQGFAWGIGIDRIAMLKYGMPDLRAFFDADVRWLNHYGFRPLDLPTLSGGLTA